MDKYGGPERRKNPRLDVNFVVSYRLREVPDSADLSQTKNVSQGGMLITTNKKFAPGIHLAVTIRFPFVPQKIELTGEVIESREVVRELIYETRVKFINLDDGFLRELGEFIKERLDKWLKK
jgi:hypothetical protein